MTSGADDPDDVDVPEDHQLRQLRQVWVSMREEEEVPSDRGMAALMAAARTQAERMKPPEPWWQRVLSTLRRPPVLAFASVAILLGGALAITQRKGAIDAESRATEPAGSPAQAPAPLAPAAGAPAGAGSSASSPPPAAPAAPPTVVADERAPAAEPTRAGPHAHVVKPGPARPMPERQLEAERDRSDQDKADLNKAPIQDGFLEPTTTTASTGESANQDATKGKASVTRAPAVRTQETKVAGPRSSGLASGLDEAPATTGAASDAAGPLEASTTQPSISQLVKQCETAAARGDCAAVRELARRIASTDAATYKQRVVANSSISRCLP